MASALESSLHFSNPTYRKAPTTHSSNSFLHGVEAFIGHLALDIEHTVTGFPTGIAMLVTHPSESIETIAKTTWHEWSPLFHGNYTQWWRQTSQHPLSPILDIVGIATLGAGSAGKLAAATNALRVAKATSEVDRLAIRTGSLARFANPGKAAQAAHIADWYKANKRLTNLKQFKTTAGKAELHARALTHAHDMLRTDPAVGRVVRDAETGFSTIRTYSNNPLIRAREKSVAALGNKVAETVGGTKIKGLERTVRKDASTGERVKEPLRIKDVVGDAAIAKRWSKMERSRQVAETDAALARTLGGIRKLGKALSGLTMVQLWGKVEEHVAKGISDQGVSVAIKPAMTARGLANTGHTEQLQHLADAGWRFVSNETDGNALKRMDAALAKNTDKGLQDAMKIYRSVITHDPVKGLNNAVQGAKPGEYLMVHSDAMGAWGKELVNSSKVAKMFYHNPTTIWKYLVLGLSPRYFVNNVLGNTVMLAMSGNPVGMARAIHMHVTMTQGRKAADKNAEAMIRAAYGPTEAAEKIAERKAVGLARREMGVEHVGQSVRQHAQVRDQTTLAEARRQGPTATAKWMKNNANFYKVTHKYSDTFHRDIAANYNIMRTPEWQAHYSAAIAKHGKSYKAYEEAYRKALESDRVRSFVRENVNHVLGQYHSFSRLEEGIQTVIPFYSWNRAITQHTIEMVKSRPYQAAMLTAIGQRGHDVNQEMLGNLPAFLGNVIPEQVLRDMGPAGALAAFFTGGGKSGRKGIFTTAGVNPYSTIEEEIKAGKALIGGQPPQQNSDSLGGMLNPVLTGVMQTISGRDPMTGAPSDQWGGALSIYTGPLSNVPPVTVAKMLMQHYGQLGGYPHPKDADHPFLYDKNFLAAASSYFGVPARNMNVEKAHELYRRENNIKKNPVKTLPKVDFTGRNSQLSTLDFKNQPAY